MVGINDKRCWRRALNLLWSEEGTGTLMQPCSEKRSWTDRFSWSADCLFYELYL